ncbi:MAG: CoA-binding protein [Nitrospiraceae bacterium]|nr:CoA-binding protein [Nitrospiraceae bacterium]
MNTVNVAVVGASPKEDRYSNRAMQMLASYGHTPIPVAPVHTEILGRPVFRSLIDIQQPVHTVAMYVGSDRQAGIIDDILRIKPFRVIFNPGTENPAAYGPLRSAGIEPLEACTLVMLSTGQF